jgi:hypothetical protein
MSDALHGSKQIVDLDIVAPTIYLPLPMDSAQFLINLGTISCRNQGLTELYESFKLEISSVQFCYITEDAVEIDVVPKLQIDFVISFLKTPIRMAKRRKFNTNYDEDADVVISGSMPCI